MMESTSFSVTPPPAYPAGKRELWLAAALLIFSSCLWNSFFTGGLNLGFSLNVLALLGLGFWYLKSQGIRFRGYSASLLILSVFLAGSFPLSDDNGLKFWSSLLLLFASSLGFCLAAGQNRRSPGSASSALDAPRFLFVLGFGGMSRSARGLSAARAGGKQVKAALLGICLALPLAVGMTILLARSDAAFEALIGSLLPQRRPGAWVPSLIFGFFTAWVTLSQGMALCHREKPAPISQKKAMDSLTWNLVLATAGILYCVYFFSQLSYLGGGFAGNLPEGYTLAQYARRGFFELAWLGILNLSLILLSMELAKGESIRLTRKLCLFLCGVTLFLTAASSAKMLLYIRSFGLTRLRILTEAFMLWLGVSTLFVLAWLFRPERGYMPGMVLTAMVLCIALLCGGVDAQAARYNIHAYQQGKLESIDISHLSSLGDGAVPYLAELAQDPQVGEHVREILSYKGGRCQDFQSWNLPHWRASVIGQQFERKNHPKHSGQDTFFSQPAHLE